MKDWQVFAVVCVLAVILVDVVFMDGSMLIVRAVRVFVELLMHIG